MDLCLQIRQYVGAHPGRLGREPKFWQDVLNRLLWVDKSLILSYRAMSGIGCGFNESMQYLSLIEIWSVGIWREDLD
ncbi:hypothetical protein [Amphritea sp. HPY]|uniref:hypothetical protein n=1 Tax=Amphritea sp. HPY TaxID=3421652 RepID=UPI003D7EC31B